MRRGMLQQRGEAGDVPQRRAKIVRHGIAERLELLVDRGQLRCPQLELMIHGREDGDVLARFVFASPQQT